MSNKVNRFLGAGIWGATAGEDTLCWPLVSLSFAIQLIWILSSSIHSPNWTHNYVSLHSVCVYLITIFT